jgi:trimethylamine--corrinoid protein Co-methyltransferase
MPPNSINFKTPMFRILSDKQIEELHCATIEVLEKTGVAFESKEAIELLSGAGADVTNRNRVKIPGHLVEKALRTAPKMITLYTREGEPAFVLDGVAGAHFGSTPNPREYLDPWTGSRRKTYVDDMVDQSRLIDALPNIEFCWNATTNLTLPIVDGGDFSGRVSLLQYLRNASKPVFCENVDVPSLKDMIRLCAIVGGGEERLRKKPFFGSSSEPVSPLIQGKEAVDKSLLCAEKGIPNIIYSMPMAGATVPATFAGALVIANAEILSHLVAVQLKKPGAPVIVGAIPSIMDMKTTIFSYGAPELTLMVGALTELLHSYKLPVFGTAGCTDAENVGIQATAETLYQIMVTVMTGADLVHDVAVAYHATVGSPELIVLVDELIGMVKVLLGGIKVNKETLALDMIERLGPRSSFLTEKHTAENFRKFWVPSLFDRSFIKTPEAVNAESKLTQKTLHLMMTHKPKPLSDDILKEMDKVEAGYLKRLGLKEYPRREA